MVDTGLGGMPPLSTQMSEALIARMAQLERENSVLRRVSLIVGLGTVAAVALSLLALSTAGFFSGANRTFIGRNVELQDANGLARGTWTVADDGSTTMQLHDQNSIARIKFSVLETGDPGVSLADAKGRTRLVFGLADHGGTIAFGDEGATTRIVLGMGPDNSTTLVFVDQNGVTRAGLGVAPDGTPSLTLFENERSVPPDTTTTNR
ncbi:MAG: hypothetical protein ACREMQ_07255 [Longimicrobiales bacterium]